MTKIKQERLSVSIDASLVQYARTKAVAEDTTISAVVAKAIRFMKRQELSYAIIAAQLEDAADPEYIKERNEWLGING